MNSYQDCAPCHDWRKAAGKCRRPWLICLASASMSNHCNLLQTIKSRWCGVVFDEPLPEAHAAGAVVGIVKVWQKGPSVGARWLSLARMWLFPPTLRHKAVTSRWARWQDHLCDMLPHRLVDRLLWKLEHDDARRFRPLPVGPVQYGDFFEMKIRWCGQTRNVPRMGSGDREALRFEQQEEKADLP